STEQPEAERNFDSFYAEVIEFVRGARILLSDSEALGDFLTDAVSVAERNLGIVLTGPERIWLVRLILNFNDILGKDDTLTEMLHRASMSDGVFVKGNAYLQAGNVGLMAAAGMAPLKSTQTDKSRLGFYTRQADVSYYQAGLLLNNPFYLSITHIGNDKIPDFIDIVRFFRFLYVQKDIISLYKFVAERTRLRIKFAPLLEKI
ncbi:hypothetical protein COT83_03520, partial [Candidatus Peregrinibacteria bacterium CG10_big_fil_rev_8_21_14_0_10_44_7]